MKQNQQKKLEKDLKTAKDEAKLLQEQAITVKEFNQVQNVLPKKKKK